MRSALRVLPMALVAENLGAAKHPDDLVDQGHFTLNIDPRHMGLGGQDSWSIKALPLEHYQVPAGEYVWAISLIQGE